MVQDRYFSDIIVFNKGNNFGNAQAAETYFSRGGGGVFYSPCILTSVGIYHLYCTWQTIVLYVKLF